ncbi:MAG TPA: PEGA domain-containing protein [Candidatus Polarisedimenticolia bacterium]|nr:PEGA domain-containing protein [Candidatus Polarisedimenticolia bacterium]
MKRLGVALPVLLLLSIVAAHWPAEAARRTIRGHSTSPRRHVIHSTHGRVVSFYYVPYFYGGGWGYYGHPYAYGYGHYPASPRYYDYGPSADVAFIDTDISPEKAEVRLDGEYIGVADNFDGYPRFLAVKPGRHTLSFSAEGRETITRRIRVPRGAVLSFDFTLPKAGRGGPGVTEDDEELVVPDPDPQSYSSEEEGAAPDGELDQDNDAGEEPGFLRLRVMPPDASVYIDGEFVGTASTLSRLHGSLRMDGGRHRVEISRPGYRTARRDVEIVPGERATVEVELERDR